MSGEDQTVRIDLRLDQESLDDDTADRLTRSLRRAIDEADLSGVDVEQTRAEAPAGSRGDAITLAALTLAVAPVFVEQVLQLVRDWCMRPSAKPVKISVHIGDREISAEYDASRMTAEEVHAFADKLRATLER